MMYISWMMGILVNDKHVVYIKIALTKKGNGRYKTHEQHKENGQ